MAAPHTIHEGPASTDNSATPPSAPPPPPSRVSPDAPPPRDTGRPGSADRRPPGDSSRVAAIWVAGTGSFLLLVAAAVFIAAKWGDIPDAAKLAAVSLMSGGFLLAGRATRDRLPGTAGAMFHLGAFLVPVNVAAIGVHLELGWEPLLLLEGVTSAVTFHLLGLTERSILLRAASFVAVVAAAGGSAAVTDVPVAVWLAACSVIGLGLRAERAAIGWALLAGLAPALAAFESHLADPSILTTLGLAGDTARAAAAGSGLVAGAVLVVAAHRSQQVVLAGLAFATVAMGGLTTWTTAPRGEGGDVLALAGLFAVVETAAALLRRDDFWGPLTRRLAHLAELAAGAGLALTALAAADWPSDAHPSVAGAFALSAIGWLVADLRRREVDDQTLALGLLTGSGWPGATLPLTASAVLAAGFAWGPTAAGLAAAASALALVASARPFGHVLAAACAPLAVLLTAEHEWLSVAIGVLGAATVAYAAVLRSRLATRWTPDAGRGPVRPDPAHAWMLAAASALPVAAATFPLSQVTGPTTVAVSILLALWSTALVLDLGDAPATRPGAGLGTVPRELSLLVLLASPALPASGVAVLAAVLVTLIVVESVRRTEPHLARLLSPPLVVLVLAVGALGDLAVAESGLALVVLGAGLLAGAVTAPTRWKDPALLTAVAVLGAGALLATLDERTTAHAAVVVGAAITALGLTQRNGWMALSGGAVATAGTWLNLVLSDVVAAEAYLAPAAGLLLAAGHHAHGRGTSSWVSYGPAVGLLGGSAVLERAAGGESWHALVAGAVGVVAVAVGGWRRLAAPLFIGTSLLIAVAAHESLAVTARVPTWGWLGLGGTVLLTAGVAMERAATGPLDTGRRLVEVIGERFS